MKLAWAALGASLVVVGCASGLGADEHGAHHPPGAAAIGSAAPTPGQVDMQMKSMQEMHAKMMAAKTPEERAALMKEHMRLMQDGMSMMGRMRNDKPTDGIPMGPDASAMGKRMDMMQMMMQMMIDRDAAQAGK